MKSWVWVLLTAGAAQAGDLPPPVSDAMFRPAAQDAAKLGQLLFWDPILSGNRNISCGTCHHPKFGTADGLPLGIGEGGIGLGPDRRPDPNNPPEERIPRNAPALFNLGAREFSVLFHDGRVEADSARASGLRTPMDDDMVVGFDGVLSAQTMFPVLSQDEMAGHYSENDVARAVRQGMITGPGGAWHLLSQRVADIPEYRLRFQAVYPEIAAGRPIAFTDISNAIASFIEFEWRSDTSPFDTVLRGEHSLADDAALGMDLFHGAAQCATCHSGPFQTDHGFHAMGVPQFGPGKAASFEDHQRDEGRMEVTGVAQDAYRFRTPSLRNVALTAPYGHTGAFARLSDFLKHHTDFTVNPDDIIANVQMMPGIGTGDDMRPLADIAHVDAIRAAVTTPPIALTDADLTALEAFLHSLTDPVAQAGRLGIPETVPSGLPIDH
ncbi:cytochrome-c peroxidase [Oceaniglobus ichthyenteri]|uniref:cytochrome-c peroxidase n=1 Tax=Oceaniglobus ichthyenteri TaxID=2136177 RepID=UPI000D3C3323|nr:cytochrome c peroxidase [Oceaniglobus ichthyenteri]